MYIKAMAAVLISWTEQLQRYLRRGGGKKRKAMPCPCKKDHHNQNFHLCGVGENRNYFSQCNIQHIIAITLVHIYVQQGIELNECNTLPGDHPHACMHIGMATNPHTCQSRHT